MSLWLPYLAGPVVLVIDLIIVVQKELARQRGLDKTTALDPLTLAASLTGF